MTMHLTKRISRRYDAYLGGKMVDHALSSESLKAAMATVPVIAPKP